MHKSASLFLNYSTILLKIGNINTILFPTQDLQYRLIVRAILHIHRPVTISLAAIYTEITMMSNS